ncbi:DUF2207 domain-containing protein, partial [Candidatus Dojkabacteria bacterium]|nr:DUF2207 domain-containing protein [Candidatus Dojkabacteria bacterium]
MLRKILPIPQLVLVMFVGWAIFFPGQVSARSLSYSKYEVNIDVSSDSTVDVEEKMDVVFSGSYQGVIRGITLENPSVTRRCQVAGYTCGGFERIALIGVYDSNGQKLDPSQYELYEQEDEDTGERYYVIKWTVWPGGRNFAGSEVFRWSLKYRLYGSLGWIGSGTNLSPYLYWNALPENRGGSVDDLEININLPSGVIAKGSSLQTYGDSSYGFVTQYRNTLTITDSNITSYGDYTIAYQLPTDAVERPAHFSYAGTLPLVGTKVKLDGVDLGNIGGGLYNFPPGDHDIEFYYDGYESKQASVSVQPDETFSLDSSLNPSPLMVLLLIADLCVNVFGLALVPVAIWWVYHRWQTKVRDQNMPATIIPLYHPPKDMPPYLLGSLKDETVDRQDIVGTLIDLAYRGYIKIKELRKGSNYELKRTGKDESDLTEIEAQLMEDIFGSSDTRETKKLGDRFATRYPKLAKKIYADMVSKGFFAESPESTRSKYLGCGIATTVLGGAFFFFLGIGALFVIGVLGPLGIGIAIGTFGLASLIAANYMPAKTELGSKKLAEVLGFRMYLYTAERYRLQGLNPDEFERYLSYAIVFGIEKEWAEKFKDIYKG